MSGEHERPNVILITVDALRADHLGFTDPDRKISTPTVDALAENSLRFDTAYANAPHTRASFPAILTGTYPWMYGGYESIADERPFIAECFDEAGYQTAGFHSNPYLSAEFNYDRGFDLFRSGEQSLSYIARCRRFVMERFFGEKKDTFVYKLLEKAYSFGAYATGRDLGLPYLTGEQLNSMVIDWIESTSEPLFLWMHYMDVHDPYIPHQETLSDGMSRKRAIKLQKKMTNTPDKITSGERKELIRLYRGEIEYLDRCLNTLLNAIDESLGPTLVVFLSDHGEAFGAHGYFRHPHEFHNEVIRIPFLVQGPDIDPSLVQTPVSTVDVLPTVLQYSDISIPDTSVGQSVFKYTSEEQLDRLVFSQTGPRETGKIMAANTEWKLIVDLETDEETLYNTREDPEEDEDLSDQNGTVTSSLRSEIDTHLKVVDTAGGGTIQEYEISGDIEDRLKQLGYK